MGCFYSKLRTTHLPVTDSPDFAHAARTPHTAAQPVVAYSPPRRSEESDAIPPNAQLTSQSVIVSNAQWQVYETLSELLKKTNRLCRQIGEKQANHGATLAPIHQSAIKLRDDLFRRTTYIEGNSPNRFQHRFNEIDHDFNAVISAISGTNQERFFDQAISFHISSPAERLNTPE